MKWKGVQEGEEYGVPDGQKVRMMDVYREESKLGGIESSTWTRNGQPLKYHCLYFLFGAFVYIT